MTQSIIKKEIAFETSALKEFEKFPDEVQDDFRGLIIKLANSGFLLEPEAKKLTKDLMELRVKHEGAWRIIYAYYLHDGIVMLVCFNKKDQKTPKQYLKLADQRLKRL